MNTAFFSVFVLRVLTDYSKIKHGLQLSIFLSLLLMKFDFLYEAFLLVFHSSLLEIQIT